MVQTAGSPLFLDTNILVYRYSMDSNRYQDTCRILGSFLSKGVTLWISGQVIREFYSVMTRSDLLSKPLTPRQAFELSVRLRNRLCFAQEDINTNAELLRLALDLDISGKQIHDANIVATMRCNNIKTLLTNNSKDFERFKGLIDVITLNDAP